MPGKLPGGKVRISSTAPSLSLSTKISPTSEIKYFGLLREEALDDLTSKPAALEQVLEDIQDPAERNAEGITTASDLSIIDGIVDFGIKFEDLEILKNASLRDGTGAALVSPRQRIADRIAQFETFSGRGTPFVGAGPVKFLYVVPSEGDLLQGTVGVTAGTGVVTGADGTAFDTELDVGDFVIITNEDGITPYETETDPTIYKVAGITNAASMVLNPAPTVDIPAGKKLRKRYCTNNPPPFYTEPIDPASDVVNSPDYIPQGPENIRNSHRVGFTVNGEFIPLKENESWWEKSYNIDFRSRPEYGANEADYENSPTLSIIKDGNLNFKILRENLPQTTNFGIRYDAWLKFPFDSSSTFAKFIAQVNGKVRIDYFKRTSIDPATGAATGTWETALDTNNPDTFFTQLNKETPVNNEEGVRIYNVQGGKNYLNLSNNENNFLDLSETYNDIEGNPVNTFNNDYVPVVIRYWFGQDTIDNSSSPIRDKLLSVATFEPSLAIDILSTDAASGDVSTWNNYFGYVRLRRNANSQWEVVSPVADYETDLSEFSYNFEILGYTDIGVELTSPVPTERSYAGIDNSKSLFFDSSITAFVPSETLTATKVFDLGLYSNTLITADFPNLNNPVENDQIDVLIQNRPFSIVPQPVDDNSFPYTRSLEELFQGYLYSPDNLDKYFTAADLLEGGTNYIEPRTSRAVFENKPEYFKYNEGNLPKINVYGPDRYDGSLVNSITTSNAQRDYDYNHSKLLFIGRQVKDDTIQPVTDLKNDLRYKAENYSFLLLEQDAAGNGGEIKIFARPVNSLAAIAGGAGEDNGGKILHGLDNTDTFSNPNRQGITDIAIEYLPIEASYDDLGNTESMRYESFLGGNIFSYATNPAVPTYDNTGVISGLTLGATDRNRDSKTILIASVDENNGTEKFFYSLVEAERRSEAGQTVVNAGGVLPSNVLFTNDSGNIVDNECPYLGSSIEFYDQTSGALITTKTVVSYVAADEEVTLNDSVDLVADGTITYDIVVYYNYFKISNVPSSVTNSVGNNIAAGFSPALPSTTPLQIRFVYNSSYEFLKVDGGKGLNFAETLFVTPGDSPTPGSPFGLNTELPEPPTSLVTPFGYDNSPSDPNDPGLGGICYPPYSTTDDLLIETVKDDSALYGSAEGVGDVYFGSVDVNPIDLGKKSLKINDQLIFDFSADQRAQIIDESPTITLPTFGANDYTHKLKVELNPFIGEITPTRTGLFARTSYTGVSNENIFKDALTYSNNKSVKELFFLFAKKAEGTGETDISLLTANDPGWL